MKYQYNKKLYGRITEKFKKFQYMSVALLAFASVSVGLAPSVSARGGSPTSKVSTIMSCSDGSLTISVNTIVNDKVNQILVQSDGVNVYQQAVARRTINTITVDAPTSTRWSVWRQERDGWLPDLNTQIQTDGTCGPNTWL